MTDYTSVRDMSVYGTIASAFQGLMMGSVTVMPAASAKLLNCVVYYAGATTLGYTNDKWYRCDEAAGGGYVWTEMSLGGGGGGDPGVYYRNGKATVTLAVADWSSNTQTVVVSGLDATDIVVSSPTPADLDAYQYCGIVQTGNATNSVTFTCDTVPESDISVNIAFMATTASSSDPFEWGNIGGTLSNQTDLSTALAGKQSTLVSGTNIKTVNNESLLGSGNLTVVSNGFQVTTESGYYTFSDGNNVTLTDNTTYWTMSWS